MFEAVTLIQTGKIKDLPVVLMGASYWKGMLTWLRNVAAQQGTIDARDLAMPYMTDDPAEAVRHVPVLYSTARPTPIFNGSALG